MTIFDPPTPPTPECLTSSDEEDPPSAFSKTAAYRRANWRNKTTSSLDDLRNSRESETTDSESSTEQRKVRFIVLILGCIIYGKNSEGLLQNFYEMLKKCFLVTGSRKCIVNTSQSNDTSPKG